MRVALVSYTHFSLMRRQPSAPFMRNSDDSLTFHSHSIVEGGLEEMS